MKHVLLRGNLIWNALQQNASSEFDLLWEILQSSDVQGYITQNDLSMLYQRIATEQDMSAAVTLLCQFRRVLEVYWGTQDHRLDVAIADDLERWAEDEADTEIPIVSIDGFLERYALDQLYESDLEPFQPGGWYRKWRASGFDPLLIIPIALTLSLKSLPELQAFLAELLNIQPAQPPEPQSWQALRSTFTATQPPIDDDSMPSPASSSEGLQPDNPERSETGDRPSSSPDTAPAVNSEPTYDGVPDHPIASGSSSHAATSERFLVVRPSLWKPSPVIAPALNWRSPTPQPRSQPTLIAQGLESEMAAVSTPLSSGKTLSDPDEGLGVGTAIVQLDPGDGRAGDMPDASVNSDTNPDRASGDGIARDGRIEGECQAAPDIDETAEADAQGDPAIAPQDSTDSAGVSFGNDSNPGSIDGTSAPASHDPVNYQEWVDTVVDEWLAPLLFLPPDADELINPSSALLDWINAEEAIASWNDPAVSPVGWLCPLADVSIQFPVDQLLPLIPSMTHSATPLSESVTAIPFDGLVQ